MASTPTGTQADEANPFGTFAGKSLSRLSFTTHAHTLAMRHAFALTIVLVVDAAKRVPRFGCSV